MKNNILTELRQLSYQKGSSYEFNARTKDKVSLIQRLKIVDCHKVHKGCVNTIAWDDGGNYILSGSDDLRLVVFDPFTGKVNITYKTKHPTNIFCARFLPQTQNEQVVSSSAAGHIFHTYLDREDKSVSNGFNCHVGSAYELVTIKNDPFVFMSCGEDCTIRCFDLRVKSCCNKENCSEDVLVTCTRPTMSMSIHPMRPFEFAAGCSDSTVRIYDRRYISPLNATAASSTRDSCLHKFSCPLFDNLHHRITSLHYGDDGTELLVSYSSEHLYLFDFKNDARKFKSVVKTPMSLNTADAEPRLAFRPVSLKTSSPSIPTSPQSSSSSSSSPPSDHQPVKSKTFHGNPLLAGVSKQLPIKRLRLRGDWSDTGPQARPERERPVPEPGSGVTSVMERMSNLMTRWLERNLIREDNPSPSNEDEGGENGDDNDEDGEIHQARNSNATVNDAQTTGSIAGIENNDREVAEATRIGREICSTSSSRNELERLNNSSTVSVVGLNEEPAKRIQLTVRNRLRNVCGGDDDDEDGDCDRSLKKSTPPSFGKEMKSYLKDDQSTDDKPSNVPAAVASSSSEDYMEVSYDNEMCVYQSQHLPTSFQRQSAICDRQNPCTSKEQQEITTGQQHAATTLQQVKQCSPTGSSQPTILISTAPVSSTTEEQSEGSSSIREKAAKTLQSFFSNRFKESTKNEKMRTGRNDDEDDEESIVADSNDGFRPAVTRCFKGHRNSRTLIKEASFWGSKYVMSGSDCGHIFIWDRSTAELVMLMEGDGHVVNCVQPHPTLPVLASSGIDYDVKIWMPIHEYPAFNYNEALQLMSRNEIMLEETKATVTVPADFMFRIFSSLSRIRRGNRIAALSRNHSTQE